MRIQKEVQIGDSCFVPSNEELHDEQNTVP